MNTVYKSENRGETLFARCMERYFVDVPEGKAVRNRGRYLFEKITNKINSQKGKTKILSLACGPAMEVQYLIQEKAHLLNSDLEFHFIDQDIEALKECQKQLETLRLKYKFKSKFFYHNQAIKNIIESGLEENNFDLIYSAGLFDYLSDAVAQYAANQLFKGIKKGGQVIVGNFDVKAPNRFGLSLVTDWNLIYRSEADLHRLFDPIAKIKMEREDLGINLFAVFYNE
jgi:extracellular factor (EF) 3-hydroxypalmitic acid methyl ester biosynthesis protein